MCIWDGLCDNEVLLDQGASLGLCDINEDSLSKLQSELSTQYKERICTKAVDITNCSAVESFLQMVKEKFGKINGIANLVGIAGRRLGHQEIWETSEKGYDFIMDVNVKGIFNLLSAGLKPGVLTEPASVVHATSMFSERGFSKGSVYSCSKHAGIGLIKNAAIEAGKRGIRVNIVMP